MSVLDCIARLHKEGKISDRQKREAEDIYNGVYGRLYPNMPAASAEARAAVETARIMEEGAKQRRLALARNAIGAQQGLDRIQQHPNGPLAGINSIMEFDPHGKEPGENIASLSGAYESRAAKLLNGMMQQLGTKAAGLKGNIPGVKTFIRQTFYDTGDAGAKELADGWAKLTGKDGEFVKEAKQMGRVFTAAEDWGRPQFWTSARVRQFRTDAFKTDVRGALDTNGLKLYDPDTGQEATPIRREAILAGAADNIVNDLPWEGYHAGAFTADMRIFRFTQDKAGADAYIKLMDKYGAGEGGYLGMMQAHIGRMSRDLAAMKLLGPDWATTLRGLRQKAIELNRQGKWDGPAPPVTIGGRAAKALMSPIESEAAITRTVDHVTGAGSRLANENIAAFWRGYRGFTTARKMGSGFVTAVIQDPVNMISEAHWLGLNSGRMIGGLYSHFLGLSKLTDDELSRMGIVFKHTIDEGLGVKRFADQWLGEAFMQRLGNAVVRGTFLDRWDSWMRSAFQQEFLTTIGDKAGVPFDKLDGNFRDHFVNRFGFSPGEWGVLSDPANHFRLGRNSVLDTSKLLGENEPLRQKVLSAMYNERNYAYLVGGSTYTRAIKGQAGTTGGEMMRNLFQFKTWPVSLLATWGTRAVAHDAGIGTKAVMGAAVLGMLTTAGAMVLAVKSLLGGKDMEDWRDPWFWGEAALQGGVAGLASDYVKDAFSRDSTSLVESIMGPWTADVVDLQKLWSSSARASVGQPGNWGAALSRAVRDAMPGSTIWYSRLAMQRMIFDQFEKMVDPNYAQSFQRQQDRLKKLRNQDFWWRPGETAPDRAPQ